jgi:hypothetical protein
MFRRTRTPDRNTRVPRLEPERTYRGICPREDQSADRRVDLPCHLRVPARIREELPTVEDLQEVVNKLRSEMDTLRKELPDEE